eukprot:scaffold89974_cov36-Tisochrysis_lutea.AAC.3
MPRVPSRNPRSSNTVIQPRTAACPMIPRPIVPVVVCRSSSRSSSVSASAFTSAVSPAGVASGANLGEGWESQVLRGGIR